MSFVGFRVGPFFDRPIIEARTRTTTSISNAILATVRPSRNAARPLWPSGDLWRA